MVIVIPPFDLLYYIHMRAKLPHGCEVLWTGGRVFWWTSVMVDEFFGGRVLRVDGWTSLLVVIYKVDTTYAIF